MRISKKKHKPRRYKTSGLVLICVTYVLLLDYLTVTHDGRTANSYAGGTYSKLATLFAFAILLLAAYQILTKSLMVTIDQDQVARLTIMVGLWIYVMTINNNHNVALSKQAILFPVVVCALTFMSDFDCVVNTLAFALIVIIIVSIWMMLVNPDVAFYNPSYFRANKIQLNSRLLAGPFSHPNALGAVVVVLSPACLVFKRKMQIACFISVGLVLVLTGSRTSLYAFLAWIVITNLPRQDRLKRIFLLTGTFISFVMMLILPFIVTSESFLSGRGIIWILSRQSFFNNPMFGAGDNFFASNKGLNLGFSSEIFTSHNLILDLLVRFGAIGFLIFSIPFLMSLRKIYSKSSFELVNASFIFLLFSTGITETHLSFTTMGDTAGFFWFVLTLIQLKERAYNNSGILRAHTFNKTLK